MAAPAYRRAVGLYRRGKIWWFKWRGQRESTHCTDRKAAEIVYADAQRSAVDPTYRPADSTTLAQALTAFEAQQKQRRAEGTVRQIGVHVAHLARLLGEHTPIARIAAREIDGYLSKRHEEGASRPTQWKEMCSLRGALKLARRHGTYPHAIDQVFPNDFEGAQSKPLDRHLTLAEIDSLLAELPPERAAVIAFIAATAADWHSVELAQTGDVNLKAGTVLVRGSKNAHRWRTVPILPPFRKWAERAAKALPFDAWTNVRRDLEVACTRAGVGDLVPDTDPPRRKVTPRDIRRSHAKALRAKGVEPHLIGRMLGHADSRMVERVYGQLPADALGDLVRARLATAPKRVIKKPAKTAKSPNAKSSSRKTRAKTPRKARISGDGHNRVTVPNDDPA